MRLRPSDRIDRFTLVELLGEGGQGSVWKACDPLHGNAFRALKLVSLDPGDSTAFERARREAKILAHIHHPALVHCHGLFEDLHSSTVGIVLDFIEGLSLDKAQLDPRMTVNHKLALLMQLLQALAHLHALGIAHRDLKPSNILVTPAFWHAPATLGTIQLVDFGIATRRANPKPLTVEGGFIGTIRYLAPEVLDPAVWGRVQEQFNRDIFAFGIIAWELLFGEHPTRLRGDASQVDFSRAYSAAKRGQLPFPPVDIAPQWGPWGQALRAALRLKAHERPASGAALLGIVQTGVDPLAQVTGNSPLRPPVKVMTAPAPTEKSPAPPVFTHPATQSQTQPQMAMGHTTAPPLPMQAPGQAPPGEHSRSWIGWGFFLITITAGVYLAFLNIDFIEALYRGIVSPNPDRESPPPFPSTTHISPPLVSKPQPTSSKPSPPKTKPSSEPPRQCSLAPCGDSASPVCTKKSFASCNVCAPQANRECLPLACDQMILPERQWKLRLASAFEVNDAIVEKYPGAELCIYQVGSANPVVCQPLAQAASFQGAPIRHLMQVQTQELTDGKSLQFMIRESGRPILDWTYSKPVVGNLYATAICIGLKLYLGPRHSVTFFLDDPAP